MQIGRYVLNDLENDLKTVAKEKEVAVSYTHLDVYKRQEDTLLSAMERAGNEELTDDTEKKGLGTTATNVKLVASKISAVTVENKEQLAELTIYKEGQVLTCLLYTSRIEIQKEETRSDDEFREDETEEI